MMAFDVKHRGHRVVDLCKIRIYCVSQCARHTRQLHEPSVCVLKLEELQMNADTGQLIR